MAVKAYILHKPFGSGPIPQYFRSSTGPYVYRSEAEKFRLMIANATGINCQLSTIEIDRILGDVVQVGYEFIITNVWNIVRQDNDYVGEVIIKGKQLCVHRRSEDEAWQADATNL